MEGDALHHSEPFILIVSVISSFFVSIPWAQEQIQPKKLWDVLLPAHLLCLVLPNTSRCYRNASSVVEPGVFQHHAASTRWHSWGWSDPSLCLSGYLRPSLSQPVSVHSHQGASWASNLNVLALGSLSLLQRFILSSCWFHPKTKANPYRQWILVVKVLKIVMINRLQIREKY